MKIILKARKRPKTSGLEVYHVACQPPPTRSSCKRHLARADFLAWKNRNGVPWAIERSEPIGAGCGVAIWRWGLLAADWKPRPGAGVGWGAFHFHPRGWALATMRV